MREHEWKIARYAKISADDFREPGDVNVKWKNKLRRVGYGMRIFCTCKSADPIGDDDEKHVQQSGQVCVTSGYNSTLSRMVHTRYIVEFHKTYICEWYYPTVNSKIHINVYSFFQFFLFCHSLLSVCNHIIILVCYWFWIIDFFSCIHTIAYFP